MARQDAAVRILLVEDNPVDARLVQALLVEAGAASSAALRFVVLRADSLRSALEIIAAQSFDAILLDLSLPDSFGLETLSHILAAAPATPHATFAPVAMPCA